MAMILARGWSCIFGFQGLRIRGERPRFCGFTDLKFLIVPSRCILLSFLNILFSSSSRGCGKCGKLMKLSLGKGYKIHRPVD